MDASRRAAVITALVLLTSAAITQPAHAATTLTRAELSGTQVRIEGSGATPGARLTVNGGTLTGTADASGSFRIQSSTFAAPPDCVVTVSDGSTSASRTLTGCSTSQPPPATSATLSSLAVTPTDVVGGDPATGTVTISATAPSGGFVIDLSSDNPTAATVPPTVTVPAGSTRATFPVTTKQVTNAQSAVIIGTVGGDFTTERHGIITAWDAFHFSHGSVSVIPGGTGAGRVTSSPAGVDCTIAGGSGSGTCSAFFTVGTVVRLDAQAAAGSKFVGFNPRPGCIDASRITVARGTNHTCQVGFQLK
ncbi:MAG TPA: hypothetical protein VFJ94_12750 [Intrasporangium sp.]|uniref:hypothetical protein n=1 Tax=Intrasporangium sp. TaxID=1925024 RepID=UPI002D79E973|nr:hypothetical protein [Intrasporangium sp.]HET7399380.1 hypothetical protein [Intrasporangium sp.]